MYNQKKPKQQTVETRLFTPYTPHGDTVIFQTPLDSSFYFPTPHFNLRLTDGILHTD